VEERLRLGGVVKALPRITISYHDRDSVKRLKKKSWLLKRYFKTWARHEKRLI
jgi:hypothetical protein